MCPEIELARNDRKGRFKYVRSVRPTLSLFALRPFSNDWLYFHSIGGEKCRKMPDLGQILSIERSESKSTFHWITLFLPFYTGWVNVGAIMIHLLTFSSFPSENWMSFRLLKKSRHFVELDRKAIDLQILKLLLHFAGDCRVVRCHQVSPTSCRNADCSRIFLLRMHFAIQGEDLKNVRKFHISKIFYTNFRSTGPHALDRGFPPRDSRCHQWRNVFQPFVFLQVRTFKTSCKILTF